MTDLVSQTDRPAHSRLGASGAERWMECSLSAQPLPADLKAILDATADPEYRAAGSCAHQAIHKALTEGLDGWELLGFTADDYIVDEAMCDSIQVYLDECRRWIALASEWGCEASIDAPDFHPEFYGTTDFWAVIDTNKQKPACLVIRDYKNGAGVTVEVQENPQLYYYSFGILRKFPDVELVDLGIVQPNVTWHPDGTVRRSVVAASEIMEWAEAVLRPAMIRADQVVDVKPGDWCRFCPRRLVCPALRGMFQAAAQAKPEDLTLFDDVQLGAEYTRLDGVLKYIKALRDETYRRAIQGHTLPGVKLVSGRSNRVWRPEAEEVLKPLFGDAIYSKPELLSPPNIEKLGPKAKELTKEWAYSPGGVPTLALESDKKPAIVVTDKLREAAQKLLDTGAAL